MKRLLILGAGTAGTMVANRLRRRLPADEWAITIVDQVTEHRYQAGYLFIPFGIYQPSEVVRPSTELIHKGVSTVLGEIEQVEPEASRVRMADGSYLPYDELVIATGVSPRPDQTAGMNGPEWRKTVFDFYTLEGATSPG